MRKKLNLKNRFSKRPFKDKIKQALFSCSSRLRRQFSKGVAKLSLKLMAAQVGAGTKPTFPIPEPRRRCEWRKLKLSSPLKRPASSSSLKAAAGPRTAEEARRLAGLPSEKWPSVKYGFCASKRI
jgi:hypothetical protein